MNISKVFEDKFFIKLQSDLETAQEYLATVLNPNEYLVKQAEVILLQKLVDDYIKHLERCKVENGSNR